MKCLLYIIEKTFSEFNFTRDITPTMCMNNKYHDFKLFAWGENRMFVATYDT